MISRKKTMKTVFTALLGGALICGAGAMLNVSNASANGTQNVDSFEMVAGASVRTDDKKAIRFTTVIAQDELDALAPDLDKVQVVTLITATEYVTGEEFDATTQLENVKQIVFHNADNNLTSSPVSWDETKGEYVADTDGDATHYAFYACLWKIKDENLTRAFTARSYIAVDGAIVDYTAYNKQDNSRDIWDVADQAKAEYDTESAEYKNLSDLSAKYDVSITKDWDDTETQFQVKRGVKLSSLAEYATATANEEYVAYYQGTTNTATSEAYDADALVVSNLELTAHYNALEFTPDNETTPTSYTVSKGTFSAEDSTMVKTPAEYKGLPVTTAGNFLSLKGVTHLILDESVKTINGNAFQGMTDMKYISMTGVTGFAAKSDGTISINHFLNCLNLQQIIIGECFNHNSAQSFVATNESYTKPLADVYVFVDKENVKKWTAGKVENLLKGNIYSYGTDGLCQTWYYAPDGYTIVMEHPTHSFVNGVCENCPVYDDLGVNYAYNTSLKEYYVSAANTTYANETLTVLSTYNDGVNGEKSVTYIADSAFKGNKTITKVVLPTSITVIGKQAFNGCTNLESVDMQGVTALGTTSARTGIAGQTTQVFNGCTQLTTVIIGSTLRIINDTSFKSTGGTNTQTRVYTKLTTPVELTSRGHTSDSSDKPWGLRADSSNNNMLYNAPAWYSETDPFAEGSGKDTEKFVFWRYVNGVPKLWENSSAA